MKTASVLKITSLVVLAAAGTLYLAVFRPAGEKLAQELVEAITPLPNAQLVSGKAAPGFTLEGLDGQRVALADFKGSNPVVVCFWATWCPHCKRALPVLHQAAALYKQAGLRVLAIDQGEERQVVAEYVEHKGFKDFSVLLNRGSKLSEDYAIKGVPQLVFIDRDGNYLGQAPAARYKTLADYSRLFQGYFGLPDQTGQRLLSEAAAAEDGEVLADFCSGLGAWQAFTDDEVRGASEAKLRTGTGTQLAFKLATSRAWSKPYLGVKYREQRPRDISRFAKIRLTACCRWPERPKHSRIVLEAGFGGSAGSGDFPSALVELALPEELATLEIPLAAFKVPAYKREQFGTELPDWTAFRGLSLYLQVADLAASSQGTLELRGIRLVE